jgi:hypothetical protein
MRIYIIQTEQCYVMLLHSMGKKQEQIQVNLSTTFKQKVTDHIYFETGKRRLLQTSIGI